MNSKLSHHPLLINFLHEKGPQWYANLKPVEKDKVISVVKSAEQNSEDVIHALVEKIGLEIFQANVFLKWFEQRVTF